MHHTMTDVSLFVTIMSVIILCYGLLILMGKCDKIILSKENTIIPFKADNFNIYKLRVLQGGFLILASILLWMAAFFDLFLYFAWVMIGLFIIEEILKHTWAKRKE